jgi:hypothetical protein
MIEISKRKINHLGAIFLSKIFFKDSSIIYSIKIYLNVDTDNTMDWIKNNNSLFPSYSS